MLKSRSAKPTTTNRAEGARTAIVDSPGAQIPSQPAENKAAVPRIFLLSPANLGGKRARILLNPDAQFPTAKSLREGKASLGDTFAFISGLYFRGKLAYSKAFARPPLGVCGCWIISSNLGLLDSATTVSVPFLQALSRTPIDPKNRDYRGPLQESAHRLREQIAPETEVVLLGSIATEKYVEPLLEIFEEKLIFPSDFVGRGDMSRGALMLRRVASRSELLYVSVRDAARSGKRSDLPKSPG
jgi:hypothetical protein